MCSQGEFNGVLIVDSSFLEVVVSVESAFIHPLMYVAPPVVVHVFHVFLCDVVTAVIVVRLGAWV